MSRFSVIETFHDYQLVDSVINRSIGMGDGTDQPFGEIGTEAFRQAWENEANENIHEFFWAYFSDLYELEIWRDDDWTTVFTGTKTGKYPDALVITDQFHVSEFDMARPGPHLGSQVNFLSLPQSIQQHIAERLED